MFCFVAAVPAAEADRVRLIWIVEQITLHASSDLSSPKHPPVDIAVSVLYDNKCGQDQSVYLYIPECLEGKSIEEVCPDYYEGISSVQAPLLCHFAHGSQHATYMATRLVKGSEGYSGAYSIKITPSPFSPGRLGWTPMGVPSEDYEPVVPMKARIAELWPALNAGDKYRNVPFTRFNLRLSAGLGIVAFRFTIKRSRQVIRQVLPGEFVYPVIGPAGVVAQIYESVHALDDPDMRQECLAVIHSTESVVESVMHDVILVSPDALLCARMDANDIDNVMVPMYRESMSPQHAGWVITPGRPQFHAFVKATDRRFCLKVVDLQSRARRA